MDFPNEHIFNEPLPQLTSDIFQTSGSLTGEVPTYVTRKADEEIYANLRKGNFCYVLSARQMGKSSLKVRTKERLEAEGFACIAIDITSIGTENATAEQWYYSFMFQVSRALELDVNIREWQAKKIEMTPVSRLREFFEDVVLAEEKRNIIIFIDEIDSLLNLSKDLFSADDFFASIRAYFNARADNPAFKRLNFAIMGVATPDDLMTDKERTPFNIGTAIQLDHFNIEEAEPLLIGFKNLKTDKQKLIQEIFYWTNGQPVLTQALCKAIVDREDEIKNIKHTVKRYVYDIFLSPDNEDENHNLNNVQRRMMQTPKHSAKMLGLYQQIVLGQKIKSNSTDNAQLYLKLTGIVRNREGYLEIANRIYANKFDRIWVVKALERVDRPYASDVDRWIEMNRHESAALKGEVLKNALEWAESRDDLSQIEREYFDFLRESERKSKEKQVKRLMVYMGTLGVLLLIVLILGGMLFKQKLDIEKEKNEALGYAQKTFFENKSIVIEKDSVTNANYKLSVALKMVKQSEMQKDLHRQIATRQKEIAEQETQKALRMKEALRLTSEALQLNNTNPTKALQKAKLAYELYQDELILKTRNKIYSENVFYNEIKGINGKTDIATFSSIDSLIYSCTGDNLFAWNLSGKMLTKNKLGIAGPKYMKFFPSKEKLFIYANDSAYIYSVNGQIFRRFYWPDVMFYISAISHNGKYIVTNSTFGKAILWDFNGNNIHAFGEDLQVFVLSIAFSPDDKYVLIGSDDNIARLYTTDGNLIKVLKGHTSDINSVAFSPDGKYIITGSQDKTAKLWTSEGVLIQTFRNHNFAVRMVGFSPNGNGILTASADKSVKLWDFEGKLITELKGHNGTVEYAGFNASGDMLLTLSEDRAAYFWDLQGRQVNMYTGHDGKIFSVDFSVYDKYFITASEDRKIQLWNSDGMPLHSFKGHKGSVNKALFSSGAEFVVSAGSDHDLIIWNMSGSIKSKIHGHASEIIDCDISPDDRLIASASLDGFTGLWDLTASPRFLKKINRSKVWSVAFGRNEAYLYIGCDDNKIRKIDFDGNIINEFEGHTGCIRDLTITNDGRFIISASDDKTVKVWEKTGQLHSTLKGHESAVLAVAVSTKGFIATGTWNSIVRLFDFNGNIIHVYSGHSGRINSLDFSSRGNYILSASDDRTTRRWKIKQPL